MPNSAAVPQIDPKAAAKIAMREAMKDLFLANAEWSGATRTVLAGDASFRKYDRVTRNGTTAVLMDAPPPEEDVRPFAKIARFLSSANFNAPRVIAEDPANGFLLLEDLGDDSFTKLLSREPNRERDIYREAGNLLAELHRSAENGVPDIGVYDKHVLQREADLLPEWYLRAQRGAKLAEAAMMSWHAAWARVFDELPALPPVLVLRDFHADNLMWLPEREGFQRIGLLDFQDALLGSPAYDLVSVLEDARRDVGRETVDAVLADYIKKTGINEATLRLHYAVLGAQRNAKIIGIFMRLTLRDNKPHYLNYIPRVWAHLRHDLKHPALAEVNSWINEFLPKHYQDVPPLAQLKLNFHRAPSSSDGETA